MATLWTSLTLIGLCRIDCSASPWLLFFFFGGTSVASAMSGDMLRFIGGGVPQWMGGWFVLGWVYLELPPRGHAFTHCGVARRVGLALIPEGQEYPLKPRCSSASPQVDPLRFGGCRSRCPVQAVPGVLFCRIFWR
ncbi:uncharacterized protein EI90DRAFT_2299173 [Cantharellus anzutake]|uniref:uncharacterized protein n=1 Tax=Cantharellus anzutake TaxID=1750568 RepID=UPI0019046248|nr:uncharacterized protein EI90DRAFT_2299173 [Cantharellus anzutake]KAF8339888.1 hypothetical protein EI90DRAFT_2299173 [Cantharellus anzutake]